MIRIDCKTLSVNEAWKGVRYKTDKYKAYEHKLMYLLPKSFKLPEPPYEIIFEFGFSNTNSDWDNPLKNLQDILSKKYKFNDKLILKGSATKVIVPKGQEYFKFEIKTFVG
jgi:hypothetical protein